MIVTKINAQVRISRMAPTGEWFTIELGAEAEYIADSDLTWSEQQINLYTEIRANVGQLSPQPRPPVEKATQLDTPPFNETREQEPNGYSPNSQTQAARPTQERPQCPDHKISRESKKGGLFCPGQMEDRSYCLWKSPAGQTA